MAAADSDISLDFAGWAEHGVVGLRSIIKEEPKLPIAMRLWKSESSGIALRHAKARRS
jgi:hypothetical protein